MKAPAATTVPPGYVRTPGQRYARGTPNVWSFLSSDPERDLVFVPTGNASPDLYGGERHGLDFYASSLDRSLAARTHPSFA